MSAEASLTLAFVGDLVPTVRAFDEAGEPLDQRARGPIGVLREADASIGCLLSPLSERGRPVDKMIQLRSAPAFAADVRSFGMDAVHLANNHITDYGDDALLDTLTALEREGVAHFGAGPDLEHAQAGLVLERAGRRVGLLAWSTLLPTGAASGAQRPGVAPLRVHVSYEFDPLYLTEEPTFPPTVRSRVDEQALAVTVERVTAMREAVDVLVVALHWGEGIGDRMAEYQQPLAHAVIDAGADLILGTHPHSVYGVEVYRGRPILYSPGLYLDQTPRTGNSPEVQALYDLLSPDSYIALATFGANGERRLRIVPTTLADGPSPVPMVATGAARERIATRISAMSTPLGCAIDTTGETFEVPLI